MTIWVNKVNRISVSVWGCAVWKNFPAMAYARTSAGPAGRPGAALSQIPASSGTELWFLATSYLEIAHWSILLRGNEGHGEDLDENGCFTSRTCVLRLDRYGSSGYFFFEKHSLIDFQIGKGRKRDFPRGRAAIFSTQRILRGRDPILSTQRIRGGDLEENRHFIEGKLVAHGQF